MFLSNQRQGNQNKWRNSGFVVKVGLASQMSLFILSSHLTAWLWGPGKGCTCVDPILHNCLVVSNKFYPGGRDFFFFLTFSTGR
jgi:hypothetical protein